MISKKEKKVKNLGREGRGVDTEGCVLVGIDIAKDRHVARVYIPGGSKETVYSFTNTREGFEAFKRWLVKEMRARGYPRAVIGMESTGHYWKALAYDLDKLPWVTLVLVNPAHVKKVKEVYDGSPSKTDKKDTGVIILLMRMKRIRPLSLPKGAYVALRVDTRYREQKVVELGIHRNRLHSLVDAVFPEYGKIFKKLESKSSLALLRNYPTPGEMVEVGFFRVSHILRKASHGRLGKDHAERVLKAARDTIGIKEGGEIYSRAIRATVEDIDRDMKAIKETEARMAGHLREIPYAKYLLKMRGMGAVTLALLLGETGDLRQYRKAKEVIDLAGLNLYEISSGKRRGQKRISKRGRPLLRKVLYFASMRMVKEGGIFRESYLHLIRDNHLQKTKAMIAISRKLLRVMIALVRDETYYNEENMGKGLAEAA